MTPEEFLEILVTKDWASSGGSTVENDSYNKDYPKGVWQRDVIKKNGQYYPPSGVKVDIIALPDIVKDAYSVPHNGSTVNVPATVMKAFRMEVTGPDFQGREPLNSARFVIYGDKAISSSISISATKSIVVHVGLREIDGRQVMVNEIVWNVQPKTSDVGSEKFYDIQKWYCCGYP
tara:strand:+ start:42 stop:569 length:528 start_codon:yes stop_codon:yes gene_type:complete